jgi:hypothetical protein
MTTPTKAARRRTATNSRSRNGAPRPAGDRTERPAAESGNHQTADQRTAGQPTGADQPTKVAHPRAAADQATRHNSTQISLPVVGSVRLPAGDELAFLAGVGVLAVVGAIEWPVAVLLGAGHALAASRRNKVVKEFGEALERV